MISFRMRVAILLMMSEQTTFTYLGILKQFCRWYDKGRYWQFVAWKRRKRPKCAINSSDLLTDEELARLLASCRSSTWKALLEGFYYSRCRPGEFLSLRRKDVTLLENEIIIRLGTGKNQYATREIIVLEDPPHFRRHVESVRNPESFLFPQLSYPAFLSHLNQIREASGLKRRIWPYLFRHTRYTRDWELGMRSETRNALYGHSPGTKMNEYYLHLSRKSLRDDLRKVYARHQGASERVVFVAPFIGLWANN
jgi:integrase